MRALYLGLTIADDALPEISGPFTSDTQVDEALAALVAAREVNLAVDAPFQLEIDLADGAPLVVHFPDRRLHRIASLAAGTVR